MRIYLSSLIQETNSFSPAKTGLDLFRRGYLLEQGDIPEKLCGTNTEIGGVYRYFSGKPRVELIPGAAAWAVASGPILDAAFQELCGRILRGLKAAMPVDGVLLALHGALIGERIDDCEACLLSEIRKITGWEIPVVCTLDYHANVTKEMVELSDLMVGFRTYPHVDFGETGERAAKALEQLVLTGERPKPVFRKLPLIVPVEDSETGKGICRETLEKLREMERDGKILTGSLFCAQPWIDVPQAGVSLLVYAKGPAPAEAEVDGMERALWKRREEFFAAYPSVEEALELAGHCEKPAILVDSGDITTAGGSGDSTVILRALLKSSLPFPSVLNIIDAESVAIAEEAGEGKTADFRVGGGESGYHQRVPIRAKVLKIVKSLSEVKGPSFAGVKVDTGTRALLQAGNIFLVLSQYSSLLYDPQLLREMGVQPEKMGLIVQKSHKLFRAAYQDIAKTILVVDTPGVTDKNLKRLPFQKVSRPVYPLDE